MAGVALAAHAPPAIAEAPTQRYTGTVSCAGCTLPAQAMAATIDLFADGSYTLKAAERSAKSRLSRAADEVGRWKRLVEGDRLSLRSGDQPLSRDYLLQADGSLAPVLPIAGSDSGRLRPIEGDSGLEPRLQLRGEWAGPPEAPTYTDCRSGQVLSVQRSPALKALSASVRQARTEAGLEATAPVVITGDGRFRRAAGLPRSARASAVVIERFENSWPGERCEVADAVAPLLETYWMLTRLGPRAVVPGDPARAAHLVLLPAPPAQAASAQPEGSEGRNPGLLPNPFKPPSRDPSVTGSTGCNRLIGRYRLSGEQLIFAPALGTTRMACPPGDAQRDEQAFGEALQMSVRHRLLGQHLELYAEDGKLLARFEAQR